MMSTGLFGVVPFNPLVHHSNELFEIIPYGSEVFHTALSCSITVHMDDSIDDADHVFLSTWDAAYETVGGVSVHFVSFRDVVVSPVDVAIISPNGTNENRAIHIECPC